MNLLIRTINIAKKAKLENIRGDRVKTGLPKKPSAENIDIADDGNIYGLF